MRLTITALLDDGATLSETLAAHEPERWQSVRVAVGDDPTFTPLPLRNINPVRLLILHAPLGGRVRFNGSDVPIPLGLHGRLILAGAPLAGTVDVSADTANATVEGTVAGDRDVAMDATDVGFDQGFDSDFN